MVYNSIGSHILHGPRAKTALRGVVALCYQHEVPQLHTTLSERFELIIVFSIGKLHPPTTNAATVRSMINLNGLDVYKSMY